MYYVSKNIGLSIILDIIKKYTYTYVYVRDFEIFVFHGGRIGELNCN